jgi:hypothetical protein
MVNVCVLETKKLNAQQMAVVAIVEQRRSFVTNLSNGTSNSVRTNPRIGCLNVAPALDQQANDFQVICDMESRSVVFGHTRDVGLAPIANKLSTRATSADFAAQ